MSIMLEYEGRMWLPATPIISNNDNNIIINDINDNSIISMKSNDNTDYDKFDMKFYSDMRLNQYLQPQIIKSGKVLALLFY